MRTGLCVGTILRSDDTVASAGTLASMLKLGQVSHALGVDVDFLPLMGAGKDLARAELLAAFWKLSKHDDLLWIDFGNAFPTYPGLSALETVADYLQVMLTLEREALYFPYTTRGGRDLSFTASPPGDGHPSVYVTVESGLRLMRLGGCGMGFTRIRRSVVAKLYEKYGRREDIGKCRAFLSDRTEMGELECIDVFSSKLGRRMHDFERPRDRPVRLLPEDDTFWDWCRTVGVEPYAVVDMPADHGKTTPGINAPTFGEFAGVDGAGAELLKVARPAGSTNGAPLIVEAR